MKTHTARTPEDSCPISEAKVKDRLPAPSKCPHCYKKDADGVLTGEHYDEILIVENKEIYGRNYGDWPWVYMCGQCGAYVGMHPNTNIPLGYLADEVTRKARKECKPVFEALFKHRKMSRSAAYKRLALELGISASECHFGMFDATMCRKAADAARRIYFNQCVK